MTAPARAADVPFFAGKTVTIFNSTSPGGGYDAYARLMAAHLGAHLPGHPTVIVAQKSGAGGIVLANYLYNVAPKDGTVLGILEDATVFAPLLNGVEVQFEAAKFGWLGSLDQFTPIVTVWHTTPYRSFADLTSTALRVGGSGAGSATGGYPSALNAVLGTKFQVINGYAGSAEITLAMERGETEGFVGWCWTCLKFEKPDWIAEKKARVLMQLGLKSEPELDAMGVPRAMDLAKTDEQRQLLRVVFAPPFMGRPFTAPPGLAADRLAVLRGAFADAAKDPALLADAAARGMEIILVPPDEVSALILQSYATDPALVSKVQAAYSGR